MTPGRQRGILLLPVALTLAIVGALAYTMTRSGSMNVSAVDARYDIENARYLAEAGMNLVKWQNEKRNCKSGVGFGTVTLSGGTIATSTIEQKGKDTLRISLRAATYRGAVHVLDTVEVKTVDLTDVEQVTVNASGGGDTTITAGVSYSQASGDYLETSDGKSHALLKFVPPGALDNGSVISAALSLTQIDTKSTQSPRSLAVHRVIRDWGSSASWTAPWANAGGDYLAEPSASIDIDGNGTYTWRIDALVQGWIARTFDNQGMLLKPNGLLDARFGSLDAAANKPKLVVRYFPHC